MLAVVDVVEEAEVAVETELVEEVAVVVVDLSALVKDKVDLHQNVVVVLMTSQLIFQ
jgi:hypothetical protein